jgi:predicted O-linked N-acetylglucosamine transferase (SPINDLY family)
VLNAVPGARMIVKGRPFAEPDICRRYLDLFAEQGIDESRVELLAYFASRHDYLEIYRRVDIVLDSFPYNGGTTTCEALWMGVPVVTLAGDRTVARMGASILACIGARDWVAGGTDAYVEIASRIADDRDRLKQIRAGLRTRMQDSPLCDGPAFADDMEAAYRAMWRRWCAADGGAQTMGGLRSAG